jgi:hypothetical protein
MSFLNACEYGNFPGTKPMFLPLCVDGGFCKFDHIKIKV